MPLSALRTKVSRETMYLPYTFFGLLPSMSLTDKGVAVTDPIGPDGAGGFGLEHDAAAVQSFNAVIMCTPVAVAARVDQVGSKSYTGLKLTLAVVEYAYGIFPIPNQWDRRQPIDFRVWWASEAAAVGARTVTWAVKYDGFSADGATPGSAADLDTLITADAPAGTSGYTQISPTGTMNPGKLVAADTGIVLAVSMAAFDAAFTEDKFFLGLEIEYTPKRWDRGLQRKAGAPSAYLT